MSVSSLHVGLMALLTFVACRSSEPPARSDAAVGGAVDAGSAVASDELPLDKVSSDEMYREQERAQKGETVGERLRAPEIVLDASGVMVGPLRVAPRSDAGDSKAQVIDALKSHLRGLRDHWRVIHPAEPFVPAPHVTIEAGASVNAAGCVLLSLAEAGYAGEARISTPPVVIVAKLRPPRTLGIEKSASALPMSSLLLMASETITVQSHYPTAQRARCGPVIAVNNGASGIEQLCNGMNCAALYLSGSRAFHDVAQDIASSIATRPGLELAFAPQPCAAPPSPPAAAPLPRSDVNGSAARATRRGKPSARRGRVTVSRDLDARGAATTLDGLLPALDACYATVVERDPELRGYVVVELVLDPSGAVADAKSVGGDLPSGEVRECVVRSALDLVFIGPSSGGVVVRSPWMFDPKG